MNPTFSKTRFLILSFGLTGVAFALRLHHLSRQELWLDEAASFFKSGTLRWHGNSAPYYWLLHSWMQFAGHDEFALRLLSALLGSLSVALMCWVGFAMLGPSTGLWSGGIAAVSPLHVYYSQEVRGYALLIFLLLLMYLTCWRAISEGTWKAWLTASCCALLACMTHYLAVIALLPITALMLVRTEPSVAPRRWVRFAMAMGIAIAVFVPWAYWGLSSWDRPLAGTTWIEETWRSTPPFLAIPKSLELFWLGGQAGLLPYRMQEFDTLQFPMLFRWTGIGLLVLLGLWVVIPWKDDGLRIPHLPTAKGWILAQLALPLLILWLVSFIKPLYVVGRYDLIAFPAFVLLMGLSLAKLQHMGRFGLLMTGTMALLFLFIAAVKLSLYYDAPLLHRARPAALALHDFVPNGDVVIFTGLQGLPVLYYLERFGYRWESGSCTNPHSERRFGCRMFPQETERRPAVYDPSRIADSTKAVRNDVEEFLAPLQTRAGSVWVVLDADIDAQEPIKIQSVRQDDVVLVEEIKRAGFRKATAPIASLPLIVQFQRS